MSGQLPDLCSTDRFGEDVELQIVGILHDDITVRFSSERYAIESYLDAIARNSDSSHGVFINALDSHVRRLTALVYRVVSYYHHLAEKRLVPSWSSLTGTEAVAYEGLWYQVRSDMEAAQYLDRSAAVRAAARSRIPDGIAGLINALSRIQTVLERVDVRLPGWRDTQDELLKRRI